MEPTSKGKEGCREEKGRTGRGSQGEGSRYDGRRRRREGAPVYLYILLKIAYGVARRPNINKNSSGDEIANVNFFYNIAHVEASAYAH